MKFNEKKDQSKVGKNMQSSVGTKETTCGFCRASSSILCHTSSLSFSFSFSLYKKTALTPESQVVAGGVGVVVVILIIIMMICVNYFCFSALYCCVQSSNSFWFISMKSFRAL